MPISSKHFIHILLLIVAIGAIQPQISESKLRRYQKQFLPQAQLRQDNNLAMQQNLHHQETARQTQNNNIINEEIQEKLISEKLRWLCKERGKYIKENNQCVDQCPKLYYYTSEKAKTCYPCQSGCLRCEEKLKCLMCREDYEFMSSSNSTQCIPKYRNNQSLPFGQNSNKQNRSMRRFLQTCPPICTSCTTGTSTCLGCVPGYVLYLGNCQTGIPPGHLNISGVAQPCTSPCSQCEGSLTNCTACVVQYYLYQPNNTCFYLQCPQFFYEKEVGRLCTACSSPCYDCESQTACVSCPIGSEFYFFSDTKQCVEICPFTFYQSDATQQCQSCISPCEDCETQTSCTSCLDGFYLLSGGDECVTQCPYGFIENDIANQCRPCTSPCQSCEGTATTCQSCIADTFLFQNQCQVSCPFGYVTNIVTRVCEDCPLPCLNCIETNCYQCQSPKILNPIANTCVDTCPDGTYSSINTILDPITDNLECSTCDPSCSKCSSQTFCTQCASGYYWVLTSSSGQCVSVCPSNAPILNANLGFCVTCSDSNCLLCDANDACFQCSSEKVLYQGSCLDSCPSGYTPDSSNSCQTNDELMNDSIQVVQFIAVFLGILFSAHVGFLVIGRNLRATRKTNIGRVAIITGLLSASWGIPATISIARAIQIQQDYFDNFYEEEARLLQTNNQNNFAFDPHLFLYILYSAAACLLCLNIGVVIWAGMIVINPKQDGVYAKWRQDANFWEKAMIYTVQGLTLLHFCSQNILWSRLKCSPKLQSLQKLHFMKVASLLGLIPATLALCSIIPMMVYIAELRTSFIEAIITLILVSFFSLLALRKDPDFFEEQVYIDPDTFKNRFRDKHQYEGKMEYKQKFHAIYQTKTNGDTPFNLDSSQREFLSQTNRSQHKKFQILPAKITEGSYYGISSGSLTSNEQQLGVDCFLRDQAHNIRKMQREQQEERKKKEMDKHLLKSKQVYYESQEISSGSNQSLVNKNNQNQVSQSYEQGSIEEGSSQQKIFIRSGSPIKVGNKIPEENFEAISPTRNISSASGSLVRISAVHPEMLKDVRISKEQYNRLIFRQRIWNLNKPYEDLSEEDFDFIRQRFWNLNVMREQQDKEKLKQRKWNESRPESTQSQNIVQKPWNFPTVKKPNVILIEEEQDSSYIATQDLNKPSEQIEFIDGIDPEKNRYMEKQSQLWMKKQPQNSNEDDEEENNQQALPLQSQPKQEEQISREGQGQKKNQLFTYKQEDCNNIALVEIYNTGKFNTETENYTQNMQTTRQKDEEQIQRQQSSSSDQLEEQDYYLHIIDSDDQKEGGSQDQQEIENQKLMVQMEEKGQYINFVGKDLMQVEEIAAALKKIKLRRRRVRKRGKSTRSISKKRKRSVSGSKHPYKYRDISAKRKQESPNKIIKPVKQPLKTKKTEKNQEGRIYVINFEDYQQLKEKAKSIKQGHSSKSIGSKNKKFRMKVSSRSQNSKSQKSQSSMTNANTFKYQLANSQSETKNFSRDRLKNIDARDNTRKFAESKQKNSQMRPGSSAIQRSGSASLTRIRSVYNNPVVRKL